MNWYRYDGLTVELYPQGEHQAEWDAFPDTGDGIFVSEEKDQWVEQGIVQGWLTTLPPLTPEMLSL
jgi:hypothetical protein